MADVPETITVGDLIRKLIVDSDLDGIDMLATATALRNSTERGRLGGTGSWAVTGKCCACSRDAA